MITWDRDIGGNRRKVKLWRKRWGTQHLKIQTFPNKTKAWNYQTH